MISKRIRLPVETDGHFLQLLIRLASRVRRLRRTIRPGVEYGAAQMKPCKAHKGKKKNYYHNPRRIMATVIIIITVIIVIIINRNDTKLGNPLAPSR